MARHDRPRPERQDAPYYDPQAGRVIVPTTRPKTYAKANLEARRPMTTTDSMRDFRAQSSPTYHVVLLAEDSDLPIAIGRRIYSTPSLEEAIEHYQERQANALLSGLVVDRASTEECPPLVRLGLEMAHYAVTDDASRIVRIRIPRALVETCQS